MKRCISCYEIKDDSLFALRNKKTGKRHNQYGYWKSAGDAIEADIYVSKT